MEPVGEFPTFPEAFKKFYEEFNAIGKKGATRLVLETCCWIEVNVDTPTGPVSGPLYIHQLGPLVDALGYLNGEGEMRDPLPSHDERVINNVTATMALAVACNELEHCERALEALRTGTPMQM